MAATLIPGGDIPPSVAITSPADGDPVSGTVTITADASDDTGVSQVEFAVDGVPIGDGVYDGVSWSLTWDTTGESEGWHALTATATDSVGQTASDGIDVMVDNFIDPPFADAGPDQVVTDIDGDGFEQVTLSASGGGSIAFDAASSAYTPIGDSNTLSWSHTTSGSSRIMIVGVTTRSNRAVTSLDYDGQGLTKIRDDGGQYDVRTDLWYLIAPRVGTHLVNLVVQQSTTIEAGATTWTGVGQTAGTALGASAGAFAGAAGWAASVDVASAGGEVVVDVVGTQNVGARVTVGPGQTQRWNEVGYWANGAASSEPGAANVTMSWSLGMQEWWAISAVALRPSGSYDPDGTIVSYEWATNDDLPVIYDGETVSAQFGVGSHIVTLTVTDDDGATASDTVQVTVVAAPEQDHSHVGDLDASATTVSGKNKWQASVSVTIHDDSHGAVPGATVTGTWSGAKTGTVSGTTGADGTVTFDTGRLTGGTEVTFTVDGVSHATLVYDATTNHDPDADSDGTIITAAKP